MSKIKINEVSKLTASDASNFDQYGCSVAISSDGLSSMVGAHFIDTNGLTNNGQVYTYARPTIDDPWTEVSKLIASDAASYDRFGSSVSISSDGLKAMVGAMGKNVNGLDNSGQVYTYSRKTVNDTWSEVSKLTASDAASSDWFGSSVSISSDGLQAIVGAMCKYTNGVDESGQVYTYSRKTVNDTWSSEVSKLVASDADSYDQFGTSVSISANGLHAIVSAYFKDINGLVENGQVYTYSRETVNDTWSEVSKLVASDAVDRDYFGTSVSISEDGLRAMVGACNKSTNGLINNGQTYTYSRPTVNDTWVELFKLTASDAVDGNIFGYSVAMSGNGQYGMVSAVYKGTDGFIDNGQVYTYNIGQYNKSNTK